MADVAPELLEKVQEQFSSYLNDNKKVTKIYNKIRDGTKLAYDEANEYAQELGDILARAFKRVFTPETLPDGKLYYNIADRVLRPMLENNYKLIADVAEYTQNSLNKAAGIGLKAVVPPLNLSRVDGLIDKSSSYGTIEEAAWVLDEPVKNYSQNIVDEAIRLNVKAQYDAGFEPRIKRTLAPECCEWCEKIAGEYKYPNVPKNFYYRHERCLCTIVYEPSKGKYQGSHSKRTYLSEHEAEIGERKHKLELIEKAKNKKGA